MIIKLDDLPEETFHRLYQYVQSRTSEINQAGNHIIEMCGAGRASMREKGALFYDGIEICVRDNGYISEMINSLKGLTNVLENSK